MISHLTSHLTPDEKHLIDLFGVGTAVAGFLSNALPTILLLLTVVWTVIRIYETDTVQRMLRKNKDGESSDSN